jgi:hypothetical protein
LIFHEAVPDMLIIQVPGQAIENRERFQREAHVTLSVVRRAGGVMMPTIKHAGYFDAVLALLERFDGIRL